MNGVDADGWSSWPAPAKLNLFLHITGRRADGYHELQTVFRLLDWGDRIRLRLRNDGRIVRVGTSAQGISEDDDLAVRAAKLLQSDANCPQGADIIVEKLIPSGAGLGGGSSDAATVLVALDHLWNTRLGEDRLADLGLRLGADVPVFVRGRNAWATGLGEILVPLALLPAWYLLIHPGVHSATAKLFQAPDLTRDSPPATISDFVADRIEGNAFEPVLRRLEPDVDAVFQALQPWASPRLTGSGSAVFVECATRAQAEVLLPRVPAGCRSWVVQGAARSSLLDAVERCTTTGASPSG
ncbi:4-(cytidine 5'-diphospho)-2-C-methyl-D-erythritol kinase [Solilutibacter silvestris]|uniref:4-(cytidine 5'-diphospho)-2-C-methyl-D-erythritol kinase n=1 Tax=Solilutibacter silvestris TaxID=1645665 RepID=UPI000CA0201F|nr:4-(cytidine 5'-diphospho)-2-C-methyl-D-erythritol kinase [Lysobacter silvestris]